jgi:NAD(P)H-flavin reductase
MPVLETIFALSDEKPRGWRGETGLVTEALARRMPALKNYDAYLCGPPASASATSILMPSRRAAAGNSETVFQL